MQRIVVKVAGKYQGWAHEIFDSGFLISNCQFLGGGSSDDRAGQRDTGAQQCFSRWRLYRCGLHAFGRR
ncbi:MAG: hypothetical protein DME82_04615 [Verrucomicrobia bacterium]|nr:MAG: hypothetical protein DME82_04615 [Verrucomicrobiota bacterium]